MAFIWNWVTIIAAIVVGVTTIWIKPSRIVLLLWLVVAILSQLQLIGIGK